MLLILEELLAYFEESRFEGSPSLHLRNRYAKKYYCIKYKMLYKYLD